MTFVRRSARCAEPSTTKRLGLRPGQRVRALGDVDTAIRGVIAETGDFACLVRWDGFARPAYVFSLDLIPIPMACAWCGASPARVVPDVSGEDHACESCLALLRAEIASNTPTPDRPPRKSSEIDGKPGYFWDGSDWVKNPDKPVEKVEW